MGEARLSIHKVLRNIFHINCERIERQRNNNKKTHVQLKILQHRRDKQITETVAELSWRRDSNRATKLQILIDNFKSHKTLELLIQKRLPCTPPALAIRILLALFFLPKAFALMAGKPPRACDAAWGLESWFGHLESLSWFGFVSHGLSRFCFISFRLARLPVRYNYIAPSPSVLALN